MAQQQTIGYKLSLLVLSFAAVCPQFGVSLAQTPPPVQEPAAELRPSCDLPQYVAVPQPDIIADLLNSRKRYRLVIGAGEFLDEPETNNRTFVDPTAILVDSRLNELGYAALPGVSRGGTPYLIGKRATREAITDALNELAAVTQGQDFGIVYYVGHGNITPSGVDLTLGIYDEPVSSDQGYRISDMFGILETGKYRSSVSEIPHLFVILDACFSGTVAQYSKQVILNSDGVQRLAEIPGLTIPKQVALLTATAAGGNSQAYELHGSGLSAFGYYFARALKEDWSCSDVLARDGMVTIQEMHEYMKDRLKLASDKGAIDAPMSPSMLAHDKDSLLAYRADKYVEPGFRNLIHSVLIQPSANQTVDLMLAGGAQSTCSDSVHGCTVHVSESNATSDSVVTVKSVNVTAAGVPIKLGASYSYRSSTQTLKLADVLNGPLNIAGATFSASTNSAAPQ